MRELPPVRVLCPTHALKIVKTDHTFKANANWTGETIEEIYRQAGTGGVLLSSMGNPKPLPVYWDKMLINASQVTNPSIDPAARADGNQGIFRQKGRRDSPR